jgi:WD repeat and SOF domain-containing protein 1
MGQFPFMSIDHHWSEPLVATCGVDVQVWDHERSEAVVTLSWGSESVQSVRFNPVERHVLASTASDRSVVLHDIRSGTAIRKLVMNKRSNAMCWNPMEAFNFVLANEDHNLYTFDMRRMDSAKCVHKDHVSAVMDVDFSPTGREFVSGSYDRTVRIFRYNEGRSREVYHGKRMQRIFSVAFSGDAKFVLSGSDDFNIRLWKANASEAVKPTKPREARAQEYQAKLKDRFKEAPEVKRIARHRHLPKAVLKASKLKGIIKESKKRKEDNVRAHSKKGAVPHVAERKKGLVKELS